jgi:hypothetical protein
LDKEIDDLLKTGQNCRSIRISVLKQIEQWGVLLPENPLMRIFKVELETFIALFIKVMC